jgi:hypothetical protein
MEAAENTLGSFLTNNFGDRYLYAVNRNAFNSIGSDSLYASTYGDKLFAEYQFNLIIGTDSGIFPKYVVKNGIPPGSRYLFIELPEVIDTLSREGVLDNLPPEVSVTALDSWVKKAEEYQLSEYIFHDSVYIHESISSSDCHLLDYRYLSWTFNLEFKTSFHKIRTGVNCTQFILRQLENLPENRVSFASTLAGAFPGRTAILLAGGPSLREALPWVKKNRDHLVIIAVSRISKILFNAAIVPHIIASVDPQKISFEVSREMLSFADGPEIPVLVNSHHASPLLVGQWGGKSVFTSALFPWQTPLNTDTLSYTGPTVSNYALSLAMHMGCETILLAGVDLCFSPEGQTHVEGSNENKVGPDLGQFSPRIETYGGWQADTNQGYAHSLQVLGIQAQMAAQRGLHIYNCSLGAAKVPFIDYKPLSEIELQETDGTASEIISARLPEPTPEEKLTHYRRVRNELERVRRKFQEILALSHEALDCTDGLFGRNGKQRDFCHKIRMDKIERKLDRSYAHFSLLVKQFGLKKFLAILKNPKEKEEWTDEQIEKATRCYYEAYVAGTGQLITIMDNAIDRIGARMEEEKSNPEIGKLISQWQSDEQFGRVFAWQRHHPDMARLLTAPEHAEFQQIKQQFECIMTEEHTSQIEILEKLHDLKHTRSKALLLFKRKEQGELEAMARGLAKHPNQEKALPYIHFINGLIAEIQGESAVAVDHYQQVLTDPPHPTTEDALRQIASLSIAYNDVDNALLAVECLVGISPTYLPPYGELLKALGRYEDAFNAYNHYLSFVPDDVGTLVSLGILCKDAGLNDMASELFQRVLEKDRNNVAAQTLLAELNIVPASLQLK